MTSYYGDVFATYIQRELVRQYGFEQFPKKDPVKLYRVYNGDGEFLSSHETEAEATRSAEWSAKQFPGKTYYVYKAITRAYVAPTPAITTRL